MLTSRTIRSSLLWMIFFSIAWHGLHQTASAGTKVIISEAIYTMGDGETPAFAEEMVLRKAKQLALEQAGTYVESYTKVRNLDLTVEEIQTLAGGIVEVEVLDQRRTMVGSGLQFFVKIKAIATTDRMEELANRVKGRDVVMEYKKLQEDYVRLSEELKTWKQTAGKSSALATRETAYAQILERQKALTAVWLSQDGIVHSLVSGQDMVTAADNEKETLDELVRTLMTQGHTIELGKGKVVRTESDYRLIVPVSLNLKEEAFRAVTNVARQRHGKVWSKLEVVAETPVRVGDGYQKSPVSIMAARVSEEAIETASFQETIDRLTILIELRDSSGQSNYCLPYEDLSGYGKEYKRLHREARRLGLHRSMWHGIPRIQSVSLFRAKLGEGREEIHIGRGVGDLLAIEQGYRNRKRGPDGKVPTGYKPPPITTENSYVALIRHEAKFRVAISLSADFARSLKQITAAIMDEDALSLPPNTTMVKCTILSEEE